MRILHVITSLYTGGAERLMVDLLPRLTDGGKNQVDLLLFNGVDTPFKKSLIEHGIGVKWLAMTNDIYNPNRILRMRKFLNGYDIIHAHNTACQMYVPVARMLTSSKAKLVATEHSSNNRRRDKWWFKSIDRWMYSRYSATVCISDISRDNLKRYVGKKGYIPVIPNGVDIQRFVRPVKDIMGKDRFVVTMVAALRAEKDHETMLKAMTHLPENYHLRLVGGGDLDAEIKALAHDLGLDEKVTFMGVRMDVPDLLEQSDINVLSSHWEGFGLVAVEGMASGRPFVASDVDGLHDIVGGAGELFPAGDDKALAAKIQWLCEHPDVYRDVATRCQQAAHRYDISITAEKYLDLYRSL